MEDFIPQVTSKDVSRIIRRDFSPDSIEIVLELLHSLDKPESNGGATARVQLAVLKASNASTEQLKHYVEIAKSDFRDVLTEAEYPNFAKLGFVGVDKMSPTEREQLKRDDWTQYLQWLTRK